MSSELNEIMSRQSREWNETDMNKESMQTMEGPGEGEVQQHGSRINLRISKVSS